MRIGILRADPAHEASRARGDRGGSLEAGELEHGIARLEATGLAVQAVLEGAGHTVVCLPVNGALAAELVRSGLDLVFNTYFGPARRQDQAHVASTLEYARIPFSGGGAACHFMGLSKPLSKLVFQASGLPTPRFFTAEEPEEAVHLSDRLGLQFPLIVKAPGEGEGIGIDEQSVVQSPADLVSAVTRVRERFSQPALVEKFLPGREFTVGVVDGEAPRVLPVLEIMLAPGRTYSCSVKSAEAAAEVCPAAITASERSCLAELAIRAGRALGCRDCWRVDFRMDASGAPSILEVNTLPGLQPGYSDLTKMAGPAGIGYDGLVREILESAVRFTRRRPS
jgi:D-alanine-D-alanine ligase